MDVCRIGCWVLLLTLAVTVAAMSDDDGWMDAVLLMSERVVVYRFNLAVADVLFEIGTIEQGAQSVSLTRARQYV